MPFFKKTLASDKSIKQLKFIGTVLEKEFGDQIKGGFLKSIQKAKIGLPSLDKPSIYKPKRVYRAIKPFRVMDTIEAGDIVEFDNFH